MTGKIYFRRHCSEFDPLSPNKDVKRILKVLNYRVRIQELRAVLSFQGKSFTESGRGLYRIIYEIKDSELVVMVVKVAHRSDVHITR